MQRLVYAPEHSTLSFGIHDTAFFQLVHVKSANGVSFRPDTEGPSKMQNRDGCQACKFRVQTEKQLI